MKSHEIFLNSKTFILSTICLFLLSIGHSQELTWEQKIGDPSVSFEELKSDFNTYWEGKEIPKGSGYKPFKRMEYFLEKRVDQDGNFDSEALRQEIKKLLEEKPSSQKSISNHWTPLGPNSIPNNNGIGRINVVAEDPNDSSRIFVGTPAGGLWYSEDSGNSWNTTTDLFPNLGVSNIVFDPNNSDIMYIGTGDRDHTFISTSTFGIMKSTDGGFSWTLTNFQPGNSGLPNFTVLHKILIHPTNSNTMIASTDTGVYRTTDAWVTWTLVLANECLRHMKFHPTNSNIIYGTTSGSMCGLNGGIVEFYRSTNNGVSWINTPLPNTTDIQRCAIGLSPATPNKIVLLASYNDPNDNDDFFALYISTNAGASFTTKNIITPPNLGSQQFYDWTLAVNPNNSNIMYAGGVWLYKSTDGGTTWASTSCTNSCIHADQHFSKFEGNRLYIANDGGLWRSTTHGSSWEDLNDGLAITQYYRISNSESNPNQLLAGSQDNGTHQWTTGSWNWEFGGDGMDNEIDPNDDQNLFVSYQRGHFFRSTNGGTTFSPMINPNATGTVGAWVTPIKIDPNNTNNIYTGYDRIWKSTDDGVTWYDPSGSALTSLELIYIDIAKSNSNYIYTTDGWNIWKSINGGTSWVTLTNPPGGTFWIDWIEIDPTNANRLWITKGNAICYSSNGGTSWSDFSTGLPNIPMNTIVYDEGSNDDLYVGSDLGVFFRDASMSAWVPFNVSLPNVIIEELDILEVDNKIRAATYGRGVWEAELVDITPDGNLCSTAIEITGCGPLTAIPPNQGNGASQSDATHSSWYKYTPHYNGTLDIYSCNAGINTRLWIHTGVCSNLTLIASSDDNCEMSPGGSNFASEVLGISVVAGTPIYIEWDNKWSSSGFDFVIDACPSTYSCSEQVNLLFDSNGLALTPFSINNVPSSCLGLMCLDVMFNADNSSSLEITNILGEDGNTVLGQTSISAADCTSSFTEICFSISQYNSWSVDGIIDLYLAPDPDIDNICPGSYVHACLTPCSTENNYSCATADIISVCGTYTATAPDRGSGGSQAGNRDAVWYKFTPTTTGTIDIYSCNGGVDTRLWIHSGSCNNLNLIANNDDSCLISTGGANYASEVRGLNVTAGVPIFIEWDNYWSSAGFNFTIDCNCPPNYSGTNQLTGIQQTSFDFETNGAIESDQIINANVDYDSGSMIELLEGFEVKLGKIFHAFIDGCGNLLQSDDNKN